MPYDRASADSFIAQVEGERARLHREIEVARARVEHARAAAVARRIDPQAEFGALILAAQMELEKIEADHRRTIEAIATAAAREAERVLAAARSNAAAMRATSVAAGVTGPSGFSELPPARVDPRAALPAGDRSDDW